MSDLGTELQKAWFTLLTGDAGVNTSGSPAIGTRVYDEVPDLATFPYIVIGEDQILGDDTDCEPVSSVISRVHVWSRAIGFPESKTIAGFIRAAVRGTGLTPSGFTVTLTQFVQAQFLKDPDGLTRHAVLEFKSLVSPA
jgi:hypothetical protein